MTYYNYLGQPMPESNPGSTTVTGNGTDGQTLQAPPGPTTVDSGSGQNVTMIGGQGDDTFNVHQINDIVEVASGLSGVKTISSDFGYTLPDNVQNLIINAPLQAGQGNSLDNLIIANNQSDGITLDGGPGNDVLVGGLGADFFVAAAGEGNDVIYGWNAKDAIRLPGTSFANFQQVVAAMKQVGPDVVLQIDPNDTLTIRNTTISSFTASNFLLKFDPSVLGAMTFDDEFNSLNLYNFSTGTGTWRDDFGMNVNDLHNYFFTSDGEKEVYTNPYFQGTAPFSLGLNPFSINNGVLTITASLIGNNQQYAFGQPISSGMLNTKDVFEQKYGYFEIRAQLPSNPGMWPAFWMVPDNPMGRELDIMESIGLRPQYDFTRAWSEQGLQTQINALKPGDYSGFHTYGVLWTPTTLTWYYDGYAVGQTATPADWTDQMYMIVNLGAGGWGGQWNDNQLPAGEQIDYIRAYALADGSTVVSHMTPPNSPSGTITAVDNGTVLKTAGQPFDAKMLANGTLVVSSAVDAGWGSHSGAGNEFNAATGAAIGGNVPFYGFASAGQDMQPTITPLLGGFWRIDFAGNGPQGFEVYDANGNQAFVDNQYTQGTPNFYPMYDGSFVVTNGSYNGRFYVESADHNTVNWISEDMVGGQLRVPDAVTALTNNGFYFTYVGSSQLDVYGPMGTTHYQATLGAANSTFAMASASLPNGDFSVAWLTPPTDGSANYQMNFQTFSSTGQAVTQAVQVQLDQDPWHTQMQVVATGQPDQAVLFWSHSGQVWGALANGSTIESAHLIFVGSLQGMTETALSNGHILLSWLQTDNGVQDLWVENLDPTTMTGPQEELGAADGGQKVVALANGAFAVSWHSGSQIEARAYDGHGSYGPVDTVSGDFLGLDSSGHIVVVGRDAQGDAVLQHYTVNLNGY